VFEADRDPGIGELNQVLFVALDALQLRLHGDSRVLFADGAIAISGLFSRMIPHPPGRGPSGWKAETVNRSTGTDRGGILRPRIRDPPKREASPPWRQGGLYYDHNQAILRPCGALLREGNAFDTVLYGGTRSNMPYTYQGWTLYSRDVKLKKGPKVTIYFFSKRKPKSGKPMDEMPKNRKVGVNKRTGLPFLRKA